MSKKMQDPTREEMIEFLNKCQTFGDDDSKEFEIEEAIYWFANKYHSGQSSNLYAALSTSQYKPGPNTKKPDDDYLFECLVEEYK